MKLVAGISHGHGWVTLMCRMNFRAQVQSDEPPIPWEGWHHLQGRRPRWQATWIETYWNWAWGELGSARSIFSHLFWEPEVLHHPPRQRERSGITWKEAVACTCLHHAATFLVVAQLASGIGAVSIRLNMLDLSLVTPSLSAIKNSAQAIQTQVVQLAWSIKGAPKHIC